MLAQTSPPPCGSMQRLARQHALPPAVEVYTDRAVNPDPMRTTPPPPEVMQVVAVVLGHRGRRRRLTGWQRDAAILAMASLGDSVHHIAWTLHLHPRTVEKVARKHGKRASDHDSRLDLWGLFVAAHGGRIALRGDDRIAALRIFARQGLTSKQARDRLLMDCPPETVSKLAANHGIKLLDIDATTAEIIDFRQRQRAAHDDQELIAA